MATNPLVPPQQQNPLIPPGTQPLPPALQAALDPPPSPSLGFQTWASDPRNAHKVQPSMTDPSAPLQPNAGNAQPSAVYNPPQTKMQAALTPPPVPGIDKAQTQLGQDQSQLQSLQQSGAAVNHVKNPVLRTLGQIGNIAAPFILGRGSMLIPGTTAHNLWLQQEAQGRINNDRAGIQAQGQQLQDQANLAHTQAETAAIPLNAQFKRLQLEGTLGKTGQKLETDDQGNVTGIVGDEDSPVYQRQQAQNDYFNARAEMARAQADLDKSKNDPTSPSFQQAQGRLRVAQQNANTAAGKLGLSSQEFGFNQEKFYNPQPTSIERSKGDLAQSAVERVQEMKTILAKHPEFFGPGAGRATNAQAWLGSQDPDAQTYLSAAQYLSDHSAGVFGGRGKYITEQLHGLTDPKSNPAALSAALDEAERAAQGFVKAGTLHGKPNAPGNPLAPPKAGGPPAGATHTVPGSDGKMHYTDGKNDLGVVK